jgi:pimeloyl-ACP methyl ester carboxylesterase
MQTKQELSSSATHARTQTLQSSHGTLAYRIIGAGPPLVLCNRFRGTLDTWDPAFLDEIAKDFQVIIFDYSGIGRSTGPIPQTVSDMAQDAKRIIDGLNLGKVTLGGWSLGGVAVQAFLAEYPESLTHAIIIGSTAMGKMSFPPEQIFYQTALKPVNDLEDEIVLFFEPKSAISRKAAEATHLRIAERIEDLDEPVPPEKFTIMIKKLAADRGADPYNVREVLKTTSIPILVLSGDHDISFPVENWYELSRSLPTVQHIVFPWSGHGPHHQYPKTAAGYIKIFIRTSTASQF